MLLWDEQVRGRNHGPSPFAWTTKTMLEACCGSYLKGDRVGRTPVFDGVCAYCGCLLHGFLNMRGLGNKCSGVPVDVHGTVCEKPGDGSSLQPPFLLRWSPSFFAQSMQDVFAHDAASNVLRLREDHRNSPPWRTTPHHRIADPSKTWLYCTDCHARWFSGATKDLVTSLSAIPIAPRA